MNTLEERITGMMLAGAIGDALGAPVEFTSYDSIISRFGGPLRDLEVPVYGIVGAVTDDTQMLMWTAEGLIREPTVESVKQAYFRWLATQRGNETGVQTDGWLYGVKSLHSSRAPGGTCLGGLGRSLREGITGSFNEPLNSGPGCGTIMRIAPVGIIFQDPDEAFEAGVAISALSHGESGACLVGGFFAGLIAEAMLGVELNESIENNISRMIQYEGHEHTLNLVNQAVDLGKNEPRVVNNIHKLGGAWRGDECLALIIYMLMSYPDNLEEAIVFASNHTGDSDSTGAIVGNYMGLRYPDQIPTRWLEKVEMRKELTELAHDLTKAVLGESPDRIKYPENIY